MIQTLSIIVPAYNEESTIEQMLRSLFSLNLVSIKKEIIVIDDGSTDNTHEILKSIKGDFIIVTHEHNQGKGGL